MTKIGNISHPAVHPKHEPQPVKTGKVTVVAVSDESTPRPTRNYLSIYVIKPRFRISWKSPSALSITSALNSIGKDYAPIGHFAVELNCSKPSARGIDHVLTGMERIDKKESQRTVLREKLGLGSLFHSFRGQLVSADQTKSEIESARRDGRLRKLTIPLTEQDASRAMDFLEQWVSSGSHTVYGGGKNTLHGEGAGCADFAETLFQIATGRHLPDSWLVKKRISKSLIGGNGREVGFLKVLTGRRWNKSEQPSVDFKIADTNRAFDALTLKTDREEYVYSPQRMREELKPASSSVPDFKFQYPSPSSSDDIWASIRVTPSLDVAPGRPAHPK